MIPHPRPMYGTCDLHKPVRFSTRIILMKASYSTYRLFFSKLQVVDGNIIDSETCVKINVSDSDLLYES
jgi:hypothetical protein